MSAPGSGGASIGIVGGGIVGLALARRLLQTRGGARVTVLVKEPAPGQHQTLHNSGVVRAGLYYAPGPLQTRLCLRGIGLPDIGYAADELADLELAYKDR